MLLTPEEYDKRIQKYGEWCLGYYAKVYRSFWRNEYPFGYIFIFDCDILPENYFNLLERINQVEAIDGLLIFKTNKGYHFVLPTIRPKLAWKRLYEAFNNKFQTDVLFEYNWVLRVSPKDRVEIKYWDIFEPKTKTKRPHPPLYSIGHLKVFEMFTDFNFLDINTIYQLKKWVPCNTSVKMLCYPVLSSAKEQ